MERVLDVIGVVIGLFVVLLAVGALRGRVRARSCCSLPAERDRRLDLGDSRSS
jgi:hypothetical protein